MELANLICKFGEKQVLVDQLNEIVLPAFFDVSLKRKYGKTAYFFDEVKLVVLSESSDDEEVIGIAGRFIRDGMLYRDQVFESGEGLVQDRDSMRTSPSAIFLLVLNNHRLIYAKEVSGAPSKEQFRSTLQSFLRRKRSSLVAKEIASQLAAEADVGLRRKREIKLNIEASVGVPKVDLVRLTSEEGIESFVDKFEILKTLEIVLKDRNDENDNDEFFDDLQRRKDAIKSTKSSVRHTNTKGLSKDAAVTEIAEATAQGNQIVSVSGTDDAGDSISGNNEKFQIRKELASLSAKPKKAAKKLYASFLGLISDGTIQVPQTPDKARQAIARIDKKVAR